MIKSWRKFFESKNSNNCSRSLLTSEYEDIIEDIEDFFADLFVSDNIEIELSTVSSFFTENKKVKRSEDQSVQTLRIGSEYVRSFVIFIRPSSFDIFEEDLDYLKSGIHRLGVKYGFVYCDSNLLDDIDPYELIVSNNDLRIPSDLVTDVEIGSPISVGNLNVYFKLNEVTVSELILAEYYDWKDYVSDESGKVFIDVNKDFLIDTFIDSKRTNSNYIDILRGDYEGRYYYNSDYTPSPSELGDQYSYLDDKNKIRILKIIIDKYGGLESFVDRNIDNSRISQLDGMSSDDFYKSMTGYRLTHTLSEMYKIGYDGSLGESTSRLFDDITMTIGDWTAQAHESQNCKEIEDSFWGIVDKHVSYTKYIKKVNKSVIYLDGKIVKYWQIREVDRPRSKKSEWVEDEERFKIPFDYDWTDIYLDLYKESLESIFTTWVDENVGKSNLNPQLSDYGDVDKKSLNAEISGIIDRYQKVLGNNEKANIKTV